MRKGAHRNFEILTGACEKRGKIKVFASVFKGSLSLCHRLSRFVERMGIAPTQPTALMTGGAESLLRLKEFLPIPTRYVLDYFHVAMKVRHADQCIGKIPPYRFSPDGSIFELYDRFNYLPGYLWSGRRSKFKESFDRLLWLLDRVREEVPESERSARMAIAHLCDLEAYLQKNASGIISYREWRNAGKRISTSAVEATVNRLIGRRMCKSRHMCWSSGVPVFFSKCGAQSSTASYLPDLVVGFQLSGRVESCWRGIGYPTTRNGSNRHTPRP